MCGLFALVFKAMSDETDGLLGPLLTVVVGVVALAPGLWIVLSLMPG